MIAFPIGLIAYRWRVTYGPLLAITQVLYTVPSLALFVLLINAVGIGQTPVIIGLTIYSLVILVRNLVEGLRAVPPEVDRRGDRDGLPPDAAAVRGRAADRAARRSSPGCGSPPCRTSRSSASAR